MTREDIENCFSYHSANAALEYYKQEYLQPRKNDSGDIVDAFETGAEWAQEFMIKRACEWLHKYASDYAFSILDDADDCRVSEALIEDFKRAMEK